MAERVGYAIAAVPAGFLPLSYIIAVGAFFLLTAHKGAVEPFPAPGGPLYWIVVGGLWGTALQWPIYVCWALASRELGLRSRLWWVAVITLLNMFGIPWFLYCKYARRGDVFRKPQSGPLAPET
jgi:hypothetical protein